MEINKTENVTVELKAIVYFDGTDLQVYNSDETLNSLSKIFENQYLRGRYKLKILIEKDND